MTKAPAGAIALADLPALHRAIGPALRDAVERVAASGRFVLGEEVAAFERALAAHVGARYAVGVGSGSDALVLALRAHGVGDGDLVMTTPLSFIATAEAIVRAGARPRFVDVDERSLCMSPTALAEHERCALVVPVHLYGRVADIAPENVVYDAAHALGARWLGGTACVSFFPAKSLGAWGDGGAVLTDDEHIADTVRRLREHGRTARHRYEAIGLNSRLDALQAAVLAAKLPHLAAHDARRRAHAARYGAAFAGVSDDLLPAPPLADGEVCHLYTVRVSNGRREALREHLAFSNIETAVHYPTLLCDQPAIVPYLDGDIPLVPNARRATSEVLSLPCHPFLDDGDVDRVIDAVTVFFR